MMGYYSLKKGTGYVTLTWRIGSGCRRQLACLCNAPPRPGQLKRTRQSAHPTPSVMLSRNDTSTMRFSV